MSRIPRLAPLLLVAAALAAPAGAQAYVNDARAAVPIPSLLGRGDAGVAVARRETAFFVNPAHVAAGGGGFHLTLLGVGAGMTPSVASIAQRLYDETQGGLDACDLDPQCDGLSNTEIVSMTRQPAELRGTLLLPSFSVRSGNVGVSVGLFAPRACACSPTRAASATRSSRSCRATESPQRRSRGACRAPSRTRPAS